MPRQFRIHPAIGVARMGNSPDAFFIGPEQPGIPANWKGTQFESFRDDQGRIKRQAARFRVFEYHNDGKPPTEVLPGSNDIVNIEWRVHLANKKASFFTFDGQSGAEDAYLTRSTRPADDHQKDDPPRQNRRNAGVTNDREARLNLDPGEHVISKTVADRVLLSVNNPHVPFIADLGELRLDEAGRLLVLGGHGISASTSDPPVVINEYANNDTWFDDASDGSIKARIIFSDGSSTDADAAWVLVGPPKFAPGIDNAVRLYDVLWDLGVRVLPLPAGNPLYQTQPLSDLIRQRDAWQASGATSLQGYRPSFTREIFPILARGLAARDVHDPGEINRAFHLRGLTDWLRLATPDPDPDCKELRKYAMGWIRSPRNTTVDWDHMPRGLGDNYDDLDDGNPVPTSFLSFTQIQYAVLEQWANGQFESDWPGNNGGIPEPGTVTPHGLDFAALEHCVGAPFYPGIEVSWLIRRPEFYAEPFRLRVSAKPQIEDTDPPVTVGALTFGPGFFTQQMALPWQADFYDCHKEQFTTPNNKQYFYMWWTAQRPDDVYPAGAAEQFRWVREFDKAAPDPAHADDDENNLARFVQMQQRWHELKFIIRAPQGANHDFEEEP